MAARSLQHLAELLLFAPEAVNQHGLNRSKVADDLCQAVPVGMRAKAVGLDPGRHRYRRHALPGGKCQ